MQNFNPLKGEDLTLVAMKSFSDRLAEALKDRGAKQKDLAVEAGVSEGMVSQWLKGVSPDQIGAGNFYRACVFLNRSVEYMLTGKGPKAMLSANAPTELAQAKVDRAALLEVLRSVIEALTLTTPGAGTWIEAELLGSPLRKESQVIDQALVAVQKSLALAPNVRPTHPQETSASARGK